MQGVLQGVHAQGNVHSWAVGEEGSQSRLNKQAEDQDSVTVEQEKKDYIREKVYKIKVRTNQKQQKFIT